MMLYDVGTSMTERSISRFFAFTLPSKRKRETNHPGGSPLAPQSSKWDALKGLCPLLGPSAFPDSLN